MMNDKDTPSAITPPPQPEDPPPKPSGIMPTPEHEGLEIASLLIRADALDSEARMLRIEASKRMIEVARAEEREACAQIAEQCSGGDEAISNRDLIAMKIRARA